REIAFAFAGPSGLVIVDVTDKTAMFEVSRLAYPTVEYCHQGWLSEDRRLLYLGDELDELQNPAVHLTTTYVINVEDIANPFLLRTFGNGLSAIDHNLMVRGDYIYEANYTTGLRIFHAASVVNIHEVGFFDTYPAHNSATFDGAWGVYTGLPSGVILVSDRDSGLFVLMADCNGNDQDDGEELRSGAGKDCNLNGILDACDITEGTAEDCNGNGVLDECDTRASEDVAASSGELSPIGHGDPQSFTLESPPFAALDVTLSFAALGDLNGGAAESIDVELNGVPLGSIYTGVLEGCPDDPYEDQLLIPAATFNEIMNGGDAIIDMSPTAYVSSDVCLYDHTFIVVDVSYTPIGAVLDCNLTARPDECEFGDFDGNHIVDSLDFAAYAACLTSPCVDAPCSPPMYLDACCGLADSDRDGANDLAVVADARNETRTCVANVPRNEATRSFAK
ncbi:MAG: choice-of-anchor B family protein, partial [Planctomycetes bacterium]|nr:choice-of-anchor B family protein [Planctomycetota bacterium]